MKYHRQMIIGVLKCGDEFSIRFFWKTAFHLFRGVRRLINPLLRFGPAVIKGTKVTEIDLNFSKHG